MPRTQIFLLLAALVGPSLAVLANEPRHFDDATLRAVQFLDEHEGWAVGDEGVVFHTMDGGKVWERQPTGVRGTLTTIQMHDFRVGWIGGRESLPFNPGSAGILLYTREGGVRWHMASRQSLSGVRSVQFLDADHGWIAGETTEQHPGGLFHTADGARTWTPMQSKRQPGWLAALFLNDEHGIVGGQGASFGRFGPDSIRSVNCDWQVGTHVRALTGTARRLWAVGDNAQIFTSEDGGRTWKQPKTDIPSDVARVWDLHGVSASGDHVWAIGRPGSVVLHSWDAGKSWKVQRTPTPIPMTSISFPNPRQGWAVGAMGTILHTEDGGDTWTVQKQSGKKSALLWLCASAQAAPLSVVSRYGFDEGVHTVAMSLTSADVKGDDATELERAAREAEGFRAAGGTYAESRTRFPLSGGKQNESVEEIQREWNRLHEGKSAYEMERDLVLAIRLWQPQVLLTDGAEKSSDNSTAATVVSMAVRRAFRTAGSANAFAEQLEFFDLKPHQAEAAYGKRSTPRAPDVRMASEDVAPKLGESFADLAEYGSASMHQSYVPIEAMADFELLEAKTHGAKPTGKLLLSAAPADARRAESDPLDDEALKKAVMRAEKKRKFLALANQNHHLARPEQLLGQLKDATGEMGMLQAGSVVFELGRRYADQGKWEFAQTAMQSMIEQYPAHPLALEAFRWLIEYQASGEARNREAAPVAIDNKLFQVLQPNADGPIAAVESRSLQSFSDPDAEKRSNGGVILLANRLAATSPQLWADPRMQLAFASAYRKLGNLQLMERHLARAASADPTGQWSQLATLERWGLTPDGAAPRPVATSSYTKDKPYLDGQLKDECWTNGMQLALKTGDESLYTDYATTVRIRYDDKFLYVAAQCRCPDASHQKPLTPRTTHDADLSNVDRIEIYVDVDRDYQSFYRLAVDQRGLVADECWGDKNWNPRWYVSTAQDEGGWRVEAAIPLTELTSHTKLTGAIWAFNATRVLPGKGVLAWSRPAGETVRPEGFTHLRFISDRISASAILPKAN